MKDNLSLDDLMNFLAVCDAGGLSGAVARTGQSAPTLSRKMTDLERKSGRRLFLRGNQGFALTADGRQLRQDANALTAISRQLAHWTEKPGPARVKITTGPWTSIWLAYHIEAFWTPSDTWIPEFISANARLDIARREADIGLRNRQPDQNWLAGRRLRRVDYAEYGKNAAVAGFVTLPMMSAVTPSTRWVYDNRAQDIVTTVTDMRLAVDLAKSGIARVILPTFAAEVISGLSRLSEPIEQLSHDEWLVTHHEARHDPPVRRALDALTRFMTGRFD